jgi:hypothetical protein
MLLPLLSPASNTFLKDWPAYNQFNCQEIDDYAGPCLTTHGLQSYTPGFSAVTTPPSLGTGGSIIGYYYKIFDQIWTWGELRFGTTGSSSGAGAWMVTTPFPVTNLLGFSTNIGEAPVVGNGYYWDDSSTTTRFPVTVHLRTSTQMMFGFRMGTAVASREVAQGIPVPVSPLDGISWSARFQRTP